MKTLRCSICKVGIKTLNIFVILSILWLGGIGASTVKAANSLEQANSLSRNGALADVPVNAAPRAQNLYASVNESHLAQVPTCETSGVLIIASGENCSLSSGAYSYDSIEVQTGGTLTLQGNTATNEGVTITTGSLAVNGIITADGLGYGSSSGPGEGADSTDTAGGAGHGGVGGISAAAGGIGYGDLYSPIALGSGGGSDSNNPAPGGAGGGAIKLVVTGDLTLDGSITANGLSGGSGWYGAGGGGSGGSIWISAGNLSGSGYILANGGNGVSGRQMGWPPFSGGGAGGRIAINITGTNTFAGSTRAWGGSGNQYGGAGTVYWNIEDRLVVNNNGKPGALTTLPSGSYEFENINLTGSGYLRILGDTSVLNVVNESLSGDGTGRMEVEGVITAPVDYTITGVMLVVLNNLIGPQNITTQAKGGLELWASSPSFAGGEYTFNSLTIGSASDTSPSTLNLVSANDRDSDYTDDYGVTLNLVNLTVNSKGIISSNGFGYGSASGPGRGADNDATAGGAGHGGIGGMGASGAAGGVAYWNVYSPTALGSGGGKDSNDGFPGGSGGGAIKLVVTGNLAMNGTITANGTDGSNGAGGGSGGSILISAGNLSGISGSEIRANGGAGPGQGGGGAGGRIAINVSGTNTFAGSAKAFGGSGKQYGGAGTVYWITGDRLVVNNNGYPGALTTLPAGSYDFENIDLRGNGYLRILEESSAVNLVNATLSGDGTGRLEVEGTINAPVDYTITGAMLVVMNMLTGPQTITTQSSGGLELWASSPAFTGGVYAFDSLNIGSGTNLRLVPADNKDANYDDDYGVTLNLVNLTVNGTITSDGLGYGGSSGLGEGTDSNDTAGGAGYGGDGGMGSSGAAGGILYGDAYKPVDLGSGGGACLARGLLGGAGGGAIKLNVTENLDIASNGVISANGANGGDDWNGASGGGSGGSIWITAGSITGSGVIRSNGGNRGVRGTTIKSYAGGGAGGRIAVNSEALSPSLIYSATGGSGHIAGSPGTIYRNEVDPNLSSLLIDPISVVADNDTQADVLVTVKNSNGNPMAGKLVEIGVQEGGALYVDGNLTGLGAYTSIGPTNALGEASSHLTATSIGTRTIVARVEQQPISQQATITFTHGAVSPTVSTINTNIDKVPADGLTPATITVTALDSFANPVPDVNVVLSTTGSAVITQPAGVTDTQGRTTGTVTDTVPEVVTLSAVVDGFLLTHTKVVTFGSADLAVEFSGPSMTAPENTFSYALQIDNNSGKTSQDVRASLTLPEGLAFLRDTASVDPVQEGSLVYWDLGDIAGSGQIVFDVVVQTGSTVADGTILTTSSSITASSPDPDLENNTAQVSTEVMKAYSYSATITPATRTLSMGATVTYTIQIKNSGLLTDTYSLSVTGLDSTWVEFDPPTVTLAAGGRQDVKLNVSTPGCVTPQTIPFTVSVTSTSLGELTVLDANVVVDSAPQIWVDAPSDDASTASSTVLFVWRTDTAATGLLTVYPEDHPEQAQTFNTASGTFHSVEVTGLTPFQSYQWTVRADSTCGTRTTDTRRLTIENAIVFVDRNPPISIIRDYSQHIYVSVHNNDTDPHTLTTSVINPYTDLYINFVESGSTDETITLQPDETRQIILAIHAQDAVLEDYVLAAKLVADEEGTTPIYDNAVLNIHISKEDNFTVQEDEAAYDPLTLGRKFVITNNGTLPITDLKIEVVDPVTNAPAEVLIKPNVDHTRLAPGESLEVMVYPIFTAEDLGEQASTRVIHLASMARQTPIEIAYKLLVSGAGRLIWLNSLASCSNGRQIYPVKINACQLEFGSTANYCVNHDVIISPISVPAWVLQEGVSGGMMSFYFDPGVAVQPYTGIIRLNDDLIGAFSSIVPAGYYEWMISRPGWNMALKGIGTQYISIYTYVFNPGNYSGALGLKFTFHVNEGTTYVCADSSASAQQAVAKIYPCVQGAGEDPEADVPHVSVVNEGGIKSWIREIAKEKGYEISSIVCTQGSCGDPINTHTGDFSFATPDLSFSTSAGDLVFQRAYSSGTIDRYTDILGYGWTHNHDVRLIFPEDEGGMEGYVLLKDMLGNQYLFKIELDGTYTPGPGVLASLTRSGTTPVTYTILTPEQATLLFDAEGRITSRADAQGHAFAYTYDESGKLITVSADEGTRYLTLGYDGSKIVSVTDYTGRDVQFTYDAAGDLVSSTDLLDRAWSYTYDENHRMTRLLDPSGAETVTTEYDMIGRAFRQSDGEGKLIARLVYNGDGSTTVYDANGDAQTYTSNNSNVVTEQKDELDRATLTTYDGNFRPTSIANAAGHALDMEWSADGINLLSKTDPAGNRTEYVYDSLNNLITERDPLLNETTYTYDGKLLISKTDTFGNTTGYTYTPEGYLETETNRYDQTTTYTYDTHGQRTSVTDWRGHVTSYVYDDLGRLVETIDPQLRVTRNVYNDAGQLLFTTVNYDPARPQNDENQYNIVTSHTYDLRGNQITVTDSLGRVTKNEYDGNNNLIKTTVNYDPGRPQNDENQYNIVTGYSYDEKGNLLSTTDTLGHETTYVYDEVGRRLTTIDALGHSSGTTTFDIATNTATATDALDHSATYYYDELNRVVKIIDPLGNTTLTTYDAMGNVATRTDPLTRVTRYEYDTLNRLVRTIDANEGVTETEYNPEGLRSATIDPLLHRTEYTYDAEGRLTDTLDPLGNHIINEYDADGNLITVNNAGSITRSEYDEWGWLTASIDAAGQRTTYIYDALGRVISTTGPTGTTTTTYDALGNVIARMDVHDRTSTTVYDKLNRVISTTDFDGGITTNSYDALGNLLSTEDALEHTTGYEYDALNRRITTTDPLLNQTHQEFDILGNLTDSIDANNVVTHYIYDELNRPSAVIQNYKPGFEPTADINVLTEFVYNEVGNRTAVIDPKGNTTWFEYDPMNRVTKKIDPLLNTWDYTYDLAGNRESMTNGNRVTTLFAYDDKNQLVSIDYPAGENDVSFGYDALGQRTSMTDGLGTTTWVYDALGRLTSVTDPNSKTVGYDYDAAGNRTHLTFPDTRQVTYTYDFDDRLSRVADWDSQVTEYTYDPIGRLLTILRPNNVDSSYTYDEAGRLSHLVNVFGADPLSTYDYTYDPAGNRIQVVEDLSYPTSGHFSALPDASPNRNLASLSDLPGQADPYGNAPPVPELALGLSTSTLPTTQGGKATKAEDLDGAAKVAAAMLFSPERLVAQPLQTGSVFVVNSLGDQPDKRKEDGICYTTAKTCTLRAAISQANDTVGPDTITFNIPGSGPYIILPASQLPAITDPVSIDGTTQPGFTGKPVVEVRGSNVPAIERGFTLSAGSSSIRGLAIAEFPVYNLLINTAGGNTIVGNHFGIDSTGTRGFYNSTSIQIDSSPNNIIGGVNPADRNVISANAHGIEINGSASSGNIIQGNYIGTAADGITPIGNNYGIRMSHAPNNQIGGTQSGAGNLISGNYIDGIYIGFSDASGNVIQGNTIGTDVTGTSSLTNYEDGIMVNGAPNTIIGGTEPGAGNLISGNTLGGIYVNASGAYGTIIQGNTIGTNRSGTLPLGNGEYGINIIGAPQVLIGGSASGAGNLVSGNAQHGIYLNDTQGGGGTIIQGNKVGTDISGLQTLGNTLSGIVIDLSTNNTIGGSSPGEGNLISGNGETGILITESGTSGNRILGNLIGTDLSGESPLGNAQDGIRIQNNAASNTIGGSEPGSSNRIAYNGSSGVYLESGTSNTVEGNLLWDNAGLGIDLAPQGVTPNDAGDADTGANGLQNFPVLNAVIGGSSTTVGGSLESLADTTYRLEFFASPTCDASGYGEGRTYLGSGQITTGSSGQGSFELTLEAAVSAGEFISATATDPSGNTSEFSACMGAVPPGGPVSITYAYDPLNRLVDATYDNGTAFHYTYDPAGNVLEYVSTIGGQTLTTGYTYDAANQLLSGTQDGVTWNYDYDGNGSLIESTPAGGNLTGASRYTYNTAGFLVGVENHDGTDWQAQAGMVYDGLGNRLSMTAWAEEVSATTNYELENGRVLTATAGDLTTTYLYGMGPIAELTDSWAYSLPDGTNTQRQLTDNVGDVTLMSSYTPWGDSLFSYGTGSFSYGYFGGIMDNATGLLYVGNGQYYDPATGRFLNRNARPEQSNPYVPWKSDPTGALFSPLLLLAMVFGNKKKRSKWDNLVILLVVGMALGIGLSACGQSGVPSEEDGMGIAQIGIPPFPTNLYYIQDGNIIDHDFYPGDPAVNLPTMNCWIILKDSDDTITPIPDPTGKKPYTILDRNLLNDSKAINTKVSPEEVYNFYIDMWNAPIDKWWWKAFGSDYDYSIWDFMSTMTYYEASRQTRFAEIMAEAGYRFYIEQPGADLSAESIINWWAIFSQNTGIRTKAGISGIPFEDSAKASQMTILGQKFQSPPSDWKIGWANKSPYDWGNLSVESEQARKAYRGQKDSLFINYGTQAEWQNNNAFAVPSGCLWASGEYGWQTNCDPVDTMY